MYVSVYSSWKLLSSARRCSSRLVRKFRGTCIERDGALANGNSGDVALLRRDWREIRRRLGDAGDLYGNWENCGN